MSRTGYYLLSVALLIGAVLGDIIWTGMNDHHQAPVQQLPPFYMRKFSRVPSLKSSVFIVRCFEGEELKSLSSNERSLRTW